MRGGDCPHRCRLPCWLGRVGAGHGQLILGEAFAKSVQQINRSIVRLSPVRAPKTRAKSQERQLWREVAALPLLAAGIQDGLVIVRSAIQLGYNRIGVPLPH